MERYIDADILRKNEIARCHCVPCVGSSDNNYKDLDEVLNDCPTADVVPKSEVERLQRYNTDVAFKHYNDGKKDVAMEIFEEIEKRSSMWGGERHIHNDIFAELKKKYTEGSI